MTADPPGAPDQPGGSALTRARAGPPDDDSQHIRHAADELLSRLNNGALPDTATLGHHQLELAQLLQAIATSLEHEQPLPRDLLRHATNIARHTLSYPPGRS